MAKRQPAETHFLVHQGCLYELDSWESTCAQTATECVPAFDQDNHVRREYRDALLRRDVPPGLCFPMAKGTTWGRVSTTGGSDLYVWNVLAINFDPFRPPGSATHHMESTTGSGDAIDRWFTKGIGIVQQVEEHHGTCDEDRQQLMRARLNGKTLDYNLAPARTVPWGPDNCSGFGWRHFSRADGTPFRTLAECLSYASEPREDSASSPR